jgi:nucleolar GTP-binding protein
VDIDKLKLTLGRLNGILPILSQIQREYLKKIKRIEVPKEGDRLRRAVFGRVSSIIKKRNEDLVYLNDIRGKLREIPSLDSDVPCIVVAGYPNVGKSSIVKLISTNKKIEVQEYPFTTKKLNIGHLLIEKDFDTIRLQIIDTPGILDRPMAERNYMELQAILALRLISDLILFIFDPTPACGYSIDSQIDLYNEIKQNFAKEGKIEMVIILNKMDLANSSEIEYLKEKLKLDSKQIILTNASTGENVDKIINLLNDRYVKNNK